MFRQAFSNFCFPCTKVFWVTWVLCARLFNKVDLWDKLKFQFLNRFASNFLSYIHHLVVQPSKRLSPEKLASFFSSTSEIASCSYEARSSGVRNGMILGKARKLCQNIVCVPYEFEKYRQVSQKLYEILVSYTHDIEAVSCDEAYIDVSDSLDG